MAQLDITTDSFETEFLENPSQLSLRKSAPTSVACLGQKWPFVLKQTHLLDIYTCTLMDLYSMKLKEKHIERN